MHTEIAGYETSSEQKWENELDDLGTEAPREAYQAHLDAAPNADSELAIYLKAHLAQLN